VIRVLVGARSSVVRAGLESLVRSIPSLEFAGTVDVSRVAPFELSGDVRIGAPDGFSTYYLAGALRDFVEKHPGVRLQLAPLPQLTPLARREVDIVVGLDKPEAGRFVARKLTDYTLGVYASAAYLEAHTAPGVVGAPADSRVGGGQQFGVGGVAVLKRVEHRCGRARRLLASRIRFLTAV